MANIMSEEFTLDEHVLDLPQEAATAEKKTIQQEKAKERKLTKGNVTTRDVDEFRIDNVPFAEWAGIRPLLEGNPRAEGVTSYTDTVFAVGRLFLLASRTKKFADIEKYMPRESRLNLIAEEVREPGSTNAPRGTNASWKFSINGNYLFTGESSRFEVEYWASSMTSNERTRRHESLLVHPETLYSKPKPKTCITLAQYVGFVNARDAERTGTHALPSMTPLEDIYRLTFEAHVPEVGKHLGRDATFERLNMVTSTTINKDFVADFIALCPHCMAKHEGKGESNKIAAAKRAVTKANKELLQQKGNEQTEEDEEDEQEEEGGEFVLEDEPVAEASRKRARRDSVSTEPQQPAKRSRQESAPVPMRAGFQTTGNPAPQLQGQYLGQFGQQFPAAYGNAAPFNPQWDQQLQQYVGSNLTAFNYPQAPYVPFVQQPMAPGSFQAPPYYGYTPAPVPHYPIADQLPFIPVPQTQAATAQLDFQQYMEDTHFQHVDDFVKRYPNV